VLRRLLGRVTTLAAASLALPWLLVVAFRARGRGDALIWGPVPVLNNRYWSEAMRTAGHRSETVMEGVYGAINDRRDFDVLFEDLAPQVPAALKRVLAPYFAAAYVLRTARIVHFPYSGGPLWRTPLWRLEAQLLRLARIRTVVIPYGADVMLPSRLADSALREAVAASAPELVERERETARRMRYWARHADAVIVGFTIDGLPRYDAALGNFVCVDVERFEPKRTYSDADGSNAPVRVLHAPNHRGFKGTQQLLDTVERLRAEGLQLDLVLLERVPNAAVRRTMRDVDLFADQFVLPGYGLAAIEAMAAGLPVLANLEDERTTGLFDEHSFLLECPIVSTRVEDLESTLRRLVRDPELRRELGVAGRAFAEKYHSYAAARHVFTSLYERLDTDTPSTLEGLLAPSSEYASARPPVRHPLVRHRLPA
jgi:glycosyltransferase involved in cell wall biosynthesis